MNKVLEKIAGQANFGGVDRGGNVVFDKRLEKFAELIVKECIKVYNDDVYQTEYEQDLKVLKHFGIEE